MPRLSLPSFLTLECNVLLPQGLRVRLHHNSAHSMVQRRTD